jgi:exo-beta-1,3-glucanase (GH17 family)
MVAARMGKITGKSGNTAASNVKAEIEKIKQERDEFRLYVDSIKDSLGEVREAVKTIGLEMSMIGLDIRKQDQDQKRIEERARFEYGESVAKDLKEFISELNYDAALAKAPEVDPTFESRFPEF